MQGDTGDGGPATQARIQFVGKVAVGPDGSVYLGQEGNGARVRRIDPEGSSLPTPAVAPAPLPWSRRPQARVTPNGMAIGPDGLLYVATTSGGPYLVRRVNLDGTIETIAGLGPVGTIGDGGPALQARFNVIEGIAFGPDGSLYVADTGNHRVRRIGQDGIITTVAGNGQTCSTGQPCGDGGSAMQAAVNPWALAVNAEGDLYVNVASNSRVRTVRSALPGNLGSLELFVASPDGSEIYAFEGRHVRTLDALTGATRYAFAYNSVGNLAIRHRRRRQRHHRRARRRGAPDRGGRSGRATHRSHPRPGRVPGIGDHSCRRDDSARQHQRRPPDGPDHAARPHVLSPTTPGVSSPGRRPGRGLQDIDRDRHADGLHRRGGDGPWPRQPICGRAAAGREHAQDHHRTRPD